LAKGISYGVKLKEPTVWVGHRLEHKADDVNAWPFNGIRCSGGAKKPD
jgi:hypothetical protein